MVTQVVRHRLPADTPSDFLFYQLPKLDYGFRMLLLDLPFVERALRQLRKDHSELRRGQDLADILPYLPVDAFDEVAAVLAEIGSRRRGDPLIAMAGWAPAERLAEVLALAAKGHAAWEDAPLGTRQKPWVPLMQAIAPRLSTEADYAAAVTLWRALTGEARASTIEIMAPYLDEGTARALLRELAALRHLKDPVPVMVAVGALAARLTVGGGDEEVRALVARFVDPQMRLTEEPSVMIAQQLAPLIGWIHPDTTRQAVRAICRLISLDQGKAKQLRPDLARLARHMSRRPDLLDDALETALRPSAWQPATRLVVLETVAAHLDDATLQRTLASMLPGPLEPEALTAIAAVVGPPPRSDAPDPYAQLRRDALDRVTAVENDRQRVSTIAAVAPCLSEPLAVEALELVAAMTRKVMFPTVLRAADALGPRLPAEALPRALDVLLDTPMFDGEEVRHVTRLMERLGHDDPTHSLQRALHPPARDDPAPDKSWLWNIAPFLDADLAERALSETRDQPPYFRRVALAALVTRLPVERRTTVVQEALRLLDEPPQWPAIPMAILARLAATHPTDEVTAACRVHAATLATMTLERAEEAPVDDFLTHLPDGAVDVALNAAAQRLYLMNRCRLLTPLVPRLPEETVRELVADLEAAPRDMGADERERARTLVAAARRIGDERERIRILNGVLARTEEQPSWYVFGPALLDMLGFAPDDVRQRAVVMALDLCVGRYADGDPEALVARLHGIELPTVLERLRSIPDAAKRLRAVAAVLSRAGEVGGREAAPDLPVLAAWRAATVRSDLFTIVAASAWWIRDVGGADGVRETVKAVLDVSSWWR